MYARLCAKENQLLSDWFKKTRTKPVMTLSYTLSDVFPRSTSVTSIYSSLTGALDCFCPLRLVKVMMQVSDLLHSIENVLNPDLLTDLDYNSEQTVLKIITIKAYRFVCKLFPQTQQARSESNTVHIPTTPSMRKSKNDLINGTHPIDQSKHNHCGTIRSQALMA